jgi:hypothetical protein
METGTLRTALVATARTRSRPGAAPPAALPVRQGQRDDSGRRRRSYLACIAWAVMKNNQDYAEAGENYYDQRNREHLIRHHQQALTRLGCQVTFSGPGHGTAARRQPQIPRRHRSSARRCRPGRLTATASHRQTPSRLRRRCRVTSQGLKFRHRS